MLRTELFRRASDAIEAADFRRRESVARGGIYYTPQTGDFLSVDPTVATTTAPYVYATSDRVNRTDGSVGDLQTEFISGSGFGCLLEDAEGGVATATSTSFWLGPMTADDVWQGVLENGQAAESLSAGIYGVGFNVTSVSELNTTWTEFGVSIGLGKFAYAKGEGLSVLTNGGRRGGLLVGLGVGLSFGLPAAFNFDHIRVRVDQLSGNLCEKRLVRSVITAVSQRLPYTGTTGGAYWAAVQAVTALFRHPQLTVVPPLFLL